MLFLEKNSKKNKIKLYEIDEGKFIIYLFIYLFYSKHLNRNRGTKVV